ncbi:MAG: hypothetical protein EA390_14430 [Balneolaceae bacterium]|nr:MAG: hypothetical protein EA390_14430 [Balneolaceae bacterium]
MLSILKKTSFLVLVCQCLIITACKQQAEVPVGDIFGMEVDFDLGDSTFMGQINDLDKNEGKYYLIDNRSQIFVLDSNFNLISARNLSGRGPGEVGRGAAIRAVDQGLIVFDSESLKFVKFDDSLKMLREFKASDLFPHLGFSFVVEGSEIYTADNSTQSLISVFNMDLEEFAGTENSQTVEGIEMDLTFFKDSKRSQARDNLYHMLRHEENLVLVNRWNPANLVLANRNGTYEKAYQYQYEDVDFFKQIIESNREFHERDENASSWKTLVRDSVIYNSTLLLLIANEESGRRHILILDLEGESIRPKKIYQLALESGEIPWVRNIVMDKDGNLLAVSSDHTGFIRYELNLNE